MDFEAEEFWCELVINGIGGRTIAEAKQRISSEEFLIWKLYREKRGSLSIPRRLEQSFGNWMAHYTQFKVKKEVVVSAFDFMPHEEAPVLTFEEQRMKAIKEKSG